MFWRRIHCALFCPEAHMRSSPLSAEEEGVSLSVEFGFIKRGLRSPGDSALLAPLGWSPPIGDTPGGTRAQLTGMSGSWPVTEVPANRLCLPGPARAHITKDNQGFAFAFAFTQPPPSFAGYAAASPVRGASPR